MLQYFSEIKLVAPIFSQNKDTHKKSNDSIFRVYHLRLCPANLLILRVCKISCIPILETPKCQAAKSNFSIGRFVSDD